MDSGNLDELVAVAKDKIGALISKPKMTEKLLAKPPFRFLHDTITAVANTTGFGEGLYGEAELDSAAIVDKHAKMAYLDKIFLLVSICKGATLEVRSLKVVQGLESEFTNKFLIALAEVAAHPDIDRAEALRRTLAGDAPGVLPIRRAPVAEAKAAPAEPPKAAKAQPPSSFADEQKNVREESKDMDSKIPSDMEQVAPERGKSRGGTRGGKPNQQTADTGLGGFTSAMAPKLDAEIEKCDSSDAMTQQLLGTLISRPKLTEKLLAKPPFRFLFDIIMEVVRATGFGKGLYSDFECDSANINEKNQKIQFLEKMIKLVGIQLNTLVEAKPARIVAGLDPQNTNNFLQLLAVAAKHMPESTSAVRNVLEQYDGKSGDGDAPAAAAAPAVAPTKEDRREIEAPPAKVQQQQPPPQEKFVPPPQQQTEIIRDDQSSFRQQQQPMSEPKENFGATQQSRFDDDNKDQDEEGGDAKRSARPTTARRRPPKVKDGAKEIQSKDVAPAANKKTSGIIVDGAADDDEDDGIVDETRLADDMKSDSKADEPVGNLQSKLVQDIMSRQAEQEAATRVNNKADAAASEETKIANENAGTNSGSGIRLGRLRKTGNEKKNTTSSTTATYAEGDLEKMRASIQSLVQQTGPLGTCMDFIQEDITLMTSELHKWEEECRRYEVEYEDAKKKTKETLHPLKVELADLEDQIMEQIAKISSAKAINAKNDEKIQSILKMMATA